MKIYKTTKGYLYKEYKNGKKVRISKENYLKHKKIKQIGGDGYKNCVIHAHGGYVEVMEIFTIPSNIRLITTTLKGFLFFDSIHDFLTLLGNETECFKNTDNGIAITKEGMRLQNQLREDFFNHDYKMMGRLVPVKQNEEYRDLDLMFHKEKGYYNAGIYVYFDGKWMFYHLEITSEGIILVILNEDYTLLTDRMSSFNVRHSPLDIDYGEKELIRVPLSTILKLLNEEAIRLNTNFNVYLNVCNDGELTNNLREENRVLFNKRRNNTIKYNATLNNTQKSGVTKNNTRTLHLNKELFKNSYFNLTYNELPAKDKRKLLPKFNITNKQQWNKRKGNSIFQREYKIIHSCFKKGMYKYFNEMTNEEKEAIKVLGFTETTWNNPVNFEDVKFRNLTKALQETARTLGYKNHSIVPFSEGINTIDSI